MEEERARGAVAETVTASVTEPVPATVPATVSLAVPVTEPAPSHPDRVIGAGSNPVVPDEVAVPGTARRLPGHGSAAPATVTVAGTDTVTDARFRQAGRFV